MSRNQYLKSLERETLTSRQVIDDLLRENYELKTLLKEAAKPQYENKHADKQTYAS